MRMYYAELSSPFSPPDKEFNSDAEAINHYKKTCGTSLLCVYRGKTEDENEFEVIWQAK